nr:MAG TPA: hypothetical protein [Caudoviricetes sp.]
MLLFAIPCKAIQLPQNLSYNHHIQNYYVYIRNYYE